MHSEASEAIQSQAPEGLFVFVFPAQLPEPPQGTSKSLPLRR